VQSFVSIGLFCRPLLAKNPTFEGFWTTVFTGVANWQQSEKVEDGCTTTNLPLSNGIKIVSVLQRLHGQMGCTISDVQTRDEQTEKQTGKQKNSTFWLPPSLTKLGMVIEDFEHVLAPLKLLGV